MTTGRRQYVIGAVGYPLPFRRGKGANRSRFDDATQRLLCNIVLKQSVAVGIPVIEATDRLLSRRRRSSSDRSEEVDS